MLFDLDLLLNSESLRHFVQLKHIAAVLPTGFGKSLLLQRLPDFLPVNNIL